MKHTNFILRLAAIPFLFILFANPTLLSVEGKLLPNIWPFSNSAQAASTENIRHLYPTDSFKDAVESLASGDTLIVHEGDYFDTGRISIQVAGSAEEPVIIMGADGEARPRIMRATTAPRQNSINIEGASYLTLKGLEIADNREDGIKFYHVDNQHITLEDLVIHDVASGINLQQSARNVTVRRTHIYNTSNTALNIGCHDGSCTVLDSLFENNWIHDVFGGIQVRLGSYGNIVRDNAIYQAAYPCIILYGTNGHTQNVVEGNALWRCRSDGIQAAADAIIRNNIILDSKIGFNAQSHNGVMPENLAFVHNTIVNADTCLNIRDWNNRTNILFANNAIYCATDTLDVQGGTAGATFAGNVVYPAAAALPNGSYTVGRSIALDFVEAANRHLYPTSDSALIDAGNISYAASTDFNGTTRTGQPDTGAYNWTQGNNPGWEIQPGFKGEGEPMMPTVTPSSPVSTPTVTPSATPIPPTSTAIPPTADEYEADDQCGLSNTISSRGMSQVHTFHSGTDVDWVQFDAEASTYYRIEVQIPPDSSADVKLEIHGDCESSSEADWDETISLGVIMEFLATTSGPHYLKLTNSASAFGEDQSYRLAVRALEAENDVGSLIIVAGRYKSSDHLQEKIHDASDNIYAAFEANGYFSDDIHYLATDTARPGYDAPATKENLRAAITEWAVSRVNDSHPLTLYLVDHGDRETFFVDEVNSERVTPTELDAWLNEVEAAVPGLEVNVIIEMCHAGSFIAAPQSISKAGRVIITSTNVENDAYVSQRRGIHFSNYFMKALKSGSSLGSSFYMAQSSVTMISALQRPWIDSDGDGKHNEVEDFDIAEQRSFIQGTLANDEWQPYFMATQIQASGNSNNGIIQATVHDDKAIASVWAEIFPPSYSPSTDGVELVMHDVVTVALTRQGNDLYEMSYDGFTELGTYRVILYAEDEDGLVSQPVAIEVTGRGVEENQQLFLPLVRR